MLDCLTDILATAPHCIAPTALYCTYRTVLHLPHRPVQTLTKKTAVHTDSHYSLALDAEGLAQAAVLQTLTQDCGLLLGIPGDHVGLADQHHADGTFALGQLEGGPGCAVRHGPGDHAQ